MTRQIADDVKLGTGTKPPPVALDKRYAQDWTVTRTAFLDECPGFAHIFYSMMARGRGEDLAYFTEDPSIPIAATDGVYLFLNPGPFFKYPLKKRLFILAHEVLHAILEHCQLGHALAQRDKVVNAAGASLPYDQMTMNIALDLVINAMLVESKVGEFDPTWLHDPSIATANDSALDVYHRIYRGGKGGGKGGASPKGGQGRFDEHMKPGTGDDKTPEQAAEARSEVEWRTAVAAAAAAARMRGKLPAGMERVFGSMIEPKVNWKDHITALFARKIGAGGYNWRRPDRRMIVRDIYCPSRSGNGCGTIVIGGDTSGSIDGPVLDAFSGHVSSILSELNPERVLVVWCDAKVGRVDELTDAADLAGIAGPPGGGGTDFRPVFDWVDDQGIVPDALVYLTDGFGPFPDDAPGYPVIWGSITAPDVVKYPFGDVVHIELD